MTGPLKLGLVGLGKIARDQHLPAIAENPELELVAVASRNAAADGIACYGDLTTMLARAPALDAVVLCQPPQVRYAAAVEALSAGKHVFLEKPPGATVTEVQALVELARANGVSLFASWHSRYAASVAAARQWIAARSVRAVSISWKEDVRHWHPGQPWIWQAGGFGVFDPGINALSILTEIIAEPVMLLDAQLEVPSNCDAPIGATLAMRTARGAAIDAVFDWRQTGPQTWDIVVDTDDGQIALSDGGNMLVIDGIAHSAGAQAEYPSMYGHFAALVRRRASDVDIAPLQLVADAFLRGRRLVTEPFHD